MRVFYITTAGADIGSLKSLHTLFDKYLDHMLVKYDQNCMVQTVQSFDFFDKKWLTIFYQKMVNHFWKRIDAILENVSVTETIVWC